MVEGRKGEELIPNGVKCNEKRLRHETTIWHRRQYNKAA